MNFKKNVFVLLCTILFSVASLAQASEDEEKKKEKFFKKENFFTGGTVGLGFGQGAFSLGLSPYFGYSINKYVDVAVSFGYSYFSQREVPNFAYKARISNYAPGVFVRAYPVKFLFAHLQYEHNFITQKTFYPDSFTLPPDKYSANVGSLLIGPGYASGRDEDNKAFYYISVLFDVSGNENSPYLDQLGRVEPVIRAGINIPLFQGSYGDRNNGNRSGNIEKY
jgi:hypothetical protein